MIAEFTAKKHQVETIWTRDGFQPRLAKLTDRVSLATPAPQFGQFNVLTFIEFLSGRSGHYVGIRQLAGPDLLLLNGLCNKHIKSAKRLGTCLLCFADQTCFCRIVN